MKRIICMLVAGLILTWGSAFADIPRTINCQGRLTDLSGNALGDGLTTYSIEVNLYTDAARTGGSIWMDNFSVQPKNGYFSVVLGSHPLHNLNQIKFDIPYWVGFTVTSPIHDSEMSPLTPLQTSPYALNAVGCVPVGTIIAWHQDMPGSSTPPLPPQFVLCNGQTLNDTESPYHNLVIPNLNGNAGAAGITGITGKPGVFLRGAMTSGVGTDDQMQGHFHEPINPPNYFMETGSGASLAGTNISFSERNTTGGPVTDGVNGTPRIGTETKPVNMTVVWIMRIK